MTLREIANSIPEKTMKAKKQILEEICDACDGVSPRAVKYWFAGKTEVPSKQLCEKMIKYLEECERKAGPGLFSEEIQSLTELMDRKYGPKEVQAHKIKLRHHAEYPPYVFDQLCRERYEIHFPTREQFEYYACVKLSDGDRGLGAMLYCGNGDRLDSVRKIEELRTREELAGDGLDGSFWTEQLPLLYHIPEDELDIPDSVMRNVVNATLNDEPNDKGRPELTCEELGIVIQSEKSFWEKNGAPKIAAAIYFEPWDATRILTLDRVKERPILASVISNFEKSSVEEKVFLNVIDRKVAPLTEGGLGYTAYVDRVIDGFLKMEIQDEMPDAENPVNMELREKVEQEIGALKKRNFPFLCKYKVKYVVSSPKGLSKEAEDYLSWYLRHNADLKDNYAFRSYLTEFPESFVDVSLYKRAKKNRKKKEERSLSFLAKTVVVLFLVLLLAGLVMWCREGMMFFYQAVKNGEMGSDAGTLGATIMGTFVILLLGIPIITEFRILLAEEARKKEEKNKEELERRAEGR